MSYPRTVGASIVSNIPNIAIIVSYTSDIAETDVSNWILNDVSSYSGLHTVPTCTAVLELLSALPAHLS